MKHTIDIRALRERCGWTQEQLAEYLGLDRSSVSRMEGGQRPKGSTEKLLRRLADAIESGIVNSPDFLPDQSAQSNLTEAAS